MASVTGAVVAEERRPVVTFENPIARCSGGCALSVFGGVYSKSGLGTTVATFDDFKNSRWGDGGIVGIAASRRIVNFSDYFQIEGEIGAAQRFGNLSSPEVWTALYFRWMAFPWDRYLDTSFAISTGFNYAFKNEALEKKRAKNGRRGSNLMHYLSPEVELALPAHPNHLVFFRFHHRSGGAFVLPGGGVGIFRNSVAGADYLTVGFRKKF